MTIGEEIQKLELDLLVEKQLANKSVEQSSKIYESQINSLQKQISELNKQLTEYTNNSKLLVQQEVEKEKDKYNVLLEDKNKQVLRITENYEKYLQQQQTETKSSKKLGDEGEDNFMLLSETFKDFVGYKIEINERH